MRGGGDTLSAINGISSESNCFGAAVSVSCLSSSDLNTMFSFLISSVSISSVLISSE